MYIRIEHPTNGEGFISNPAMWNSFSDDIYREFIITHENFPTPRREGLFIKHSEFCAFRSKKIFKKHFKENHLKFFISKGFRIYQITPKNSKKIKKGNYQILFKKEHVIYKDITEEYV